MRADLVLWPTTVRRTAFLFAQIAKGMGFRIVSFEWDDHAGDEQSGEMVPLYGVCERCGGVGR
jgi:hypothetical protein